MPQVFEQSRSCFQRTLLFRRGKKTGRVPLFSILVIWPNYSSLPPFPILRKRISRQKNVRSNPIWWQATSKAHFFSIGNIFGCQSKCWFQVRPDFFGTSSSRTLGHIRLPTKWTKMKFPFCWMYKRGTFFHNCEIYGGCCDPIQMGREERDLPTWFK